MMLEITDLIGRISSIINEHTGSNIISFPVETLEIKFFIDKLKLSASELY